MTYLPYLFGGVRLILGLAILIKLLGLFGSAPFKPDGFFSKHGTLAFLLSGFLILSGLYTIFFSSSEDYRVGVSNESWAAGDRQVLIKNCLRDSKSLAVEHPQASREYCECSVDKIIASVTKKQYLEDNKKPTFEQIKNQFKYFKDCLDILSVQVKKRQESKNAKIRGH